jgi:membrane-associated phospholipid phosphatase
MSASRSPARTGALLTLGGLLLLAACALVARTGTVGPAERAVFHAVNDLPGWLYRPMWVFQQAGNLLVALGLLLVVALVLRRPKLAAAAVVAVVAKLGLERVVKSVVERRRPGTTIGDVIFRGDVPVHGLSFVSGHAAITAAGATMLMAVLPRRWQPLPWIVVVLNGVARVYVGAHNPLDIVGGVGLGLIIGGPLYLWLSHRPPAAGFIDVTPATVPAGAS